MALEVRRGAASPAAAAAALLAALLDTLFRRETRWAGLREPASELELPREWECREGRLEATEPTEERFDGREISWSGSQRRYRERGPIRRRTLVAVMIGVARGLSGLAGGERGDDGSWGDCLAVARWEEECEVCGGVGEQLLVDGPGGVRLGACCPCKRTLKGS